MTDETSVIEDWEQERPGVQSKGRQNERHSEESRWWMDGRKEEEFGRETRL